MPTQQAAMSDSRLEVEWTPDQVAQFWDYQSHRPSAEKNYFSAGNGGRIVSRALRFLRPRSRVLDLGCGPGHLIRHLHAAGRPLDIVGADFSPASVERARTLSADLRPEPRFEVVAGYPTHFGPGTFDAVFSVEVVEHLPDAVLDPMLSEVFRLLAPGGTFVVTTPNAENLELLHTCCPACSSTFHIWQHVRSWTPETLSARLSSAGFVPVEVVATRFESKLVRLAFWLARKLGRTKSGNPHLLGIFRKPA